MFDDIKGINDGPNGSKITFKRKDLKRPLTHEEIETILYDTHFEYPIEMLRVLNPIVDNVVTVSAIPPVIVLVA